MPYREMARVRGEPGSGGIKSFHRSLHNQLDRWLVGVVAIDGDKFALFTLSPGGMKDNMQFDLFAGKDNALAG